MHDNYHNVKSFSFNLNHNFPDSFILRFYTSAAVALLSSFLLPLCFSLSIQVCLIFGANPGFFRYLHNTDAVTDSLSTDDRDDAKTTPVPKPQV